MKHIFELRMKDQIECSSCVVTARIFLLFDYKESWQQLKVKAICHKILVGISTNFLQINQAYKFFFESRKRPSAKKNLLKGELKEASLGNLKKHSNEDQDTVSLTGIPVTHLSEQMQNNTCII